MSDKKKKFDDAGRPTARDIIERLFGPEHADHSAAGVDKMNTAIIVRCTCGKHALMDDDDCRKRGLGRNTASGDYVYDSALKEAKEGLRNVQAIPVGSVS